MSLQTESWICSSENAASIDAEGIEFFTGLLIILQSFRGTKGLLDWSRGKLVPRVSLADKFSMRSALLRPFYYQEVDQLSGLSLRNVQHHFPSETDIKEIRRLITFLMNLSSRFWK